MSAALPAEIEAFVRELAAMSGAVAVVLGGSRGTGEIDDDSDWDLAVLYRGTLDLGVLARHGPVHPPGSWGRFMNGGAWLRIGERKVDVLLRDVDVVEHWASRAQAGEYEVDLLLGYLAGIPSYTLLAERAIGVVLAGSPPAAGPYPAALAETGARRWRFHRDFSLDHARMHARRGDIAGAVGQTSRAAIEAAHARLCDRRVWVVNEKRILERAGLEALHPRFARVPVDREGLLAWIAAIEAELVDDPR